MTDKIYCGNGRVLTTKFGQMLKLSLTSEDVQALMDNIDNGWVNIKVCKRKEPSEKGTTHYLEIDTWKPEKKADAKPEEKAVEKSPDDPATKEDLESLPF